MQEVLRLKDFALVEARLWEILPGVFAKDIHALIPREEVLAELVEKLGYKQVEEGDVLRYAFATRQDPRHWPFGSGRRFLMNPHTDAAPDGSPVDYRGPWADCGTAGYELGLWRTKAEDKDNPETIRFPQLCFHPVQLSYPVLRALIVKQPL